MPRRPFQFGEFVGQRRVLEPVLREQDGARRRNLLKLAVFPGMSLGVARLVRRGGIRRPPGSVC